MKKRCERGNMIRFELDLDTHTIKGYTNSWVFAESLMEEGGKAKQAGRGWIFEMPAQAAVKRW